MPKRPLSILVLEAYDGGSHGCFLDGLIGASGHRTHRIGLPARKWIWRMRGSALYFAEAIESLDAGAFDILFTSDMTSVADFKALLPRQWQQKPIVCYFHENQLTYPLPDEEQRDYNYAFTNISSALTADAVWFNSAYHRDSFLSAVEVLFQKMADCVPAGIAQRIAERSRVMPLGLPDDVFVIPSGTVSFPLHPPIVLWNHRWEYDKNPDAFFEVMLDLHRAGLEFELLILGEQFRKSPPIFEAAKSLLRPHLRHFGYVPSRQAYLDYLHQADIVVSTSIHEFFGLSVLEAIARGCYPLLPNRLSYPELIPASCHEELLYSSDTELRSRLAEMLRGGVPAAPQELRNTTARLAWSRLSAVYDEAFAHVWASSSSHR